MFVLGIDQSRSTTWASNKEMEWTHDFSMMEMMRRMQAHHGSLESKACISHAPVHCSMNRGQMIVIHNLFTFFLMFLLLPTRQEHAFESSQKYKEGKFIIELAHMIKENGWEDDGNDEKKR